ncbi:hypothetical protein [Polyangium mundeleinium]|uniref:Transposase n=1 Tax=Polyangium mundeleinium TaxID=2995306 RepID=A0ABT5F0T0_9BACT|nr:hypothetical protein [Polyangium mundeleinium]MDC0747660.1 hypothetical protein [Polyangium mundeleinium]
MPDDVIEDGSRLAEVLEEATMEDGKPLAYKLAALEARRHRNGRKTRRSTLRRPISDVRSPLRPFLAEPTSP